MAQPKKRTRISAAEFKARCLEVFDDVSNDGDEVVVTKHTRPVVRIVPSRGSLPVRRAHFAYLVNGPIGDVVSPLDVEWDAMK